MSIVRLIHASSLLIWFSVQQLEKFPLPNGLGEIFGVEQHCSIPTLASIGDFSLSQICSRIQNSAQFRAAIKLCPNMTIGPPTLSDTSYDQCAGKRPRESEIGFNAHAYGAF